MYKQASTGTTGTIVMSLSPISCQLCASGATEHRIMFLGLTSGNNAVFGGAVMTLPYHSKPYYRETKQYDKYLHLACVDTYTRARAKSPYRHTIVSCPTLLFKHILTIFPSLPSFPSLAASTGLAANTED